MDKPNPRIDYYAIQGNYGGVSGWEDLTAEETYTAAKESLQNYRKNDTESLDFRIQKVYKSGRRITVK